MAEAVRLLRDKAALTRLLVLLELQRATHTRLKGLAEALGITVQGVSNYITELERQGLVRAGRGRYEATPKGTALLQEHLAELKAFVDVAWQRASVVQACSAIARTRVRAGERVGLFMEQGLLVARARKASPSRGLADQAAEPGEVVRVRGLEGLVALRPGRLVVLKVPAVAGRETRAAAAALRRWLARERPRPERLAALGTEAHAVLAAAKLRADLAFAPAHAAHHAAQLGLDALLVASADEARFATAELDRLNEDALDPVRYELRELRVRL